MGYDNNGQANLVNMLDIGAIFGSMALGYISDKTYGKRSLVSFVAVVLASMIAIIIYD